MRKLTLFLLLYAATAFGQGSVVTGAPVVTNALGQPLAGATVAVCTTDPGTPVTGGCPAHLATTYTDITIGTPCTGSAKPLSNPGGAGSSCSNPGTADGQGNVVAFAAQGQYWCEYYGTGIIGVKVIPCIFPTTASSGSFTFTNITATGSVTAATIEGITFANSTIQAAITSLAGGSGTVYIPCGTYTQNTAITGIASGQTIKGYNRACVIINTTLSAGVLFNIADKADVTIEGFTVNKTGSAGGTAIQGGYGQNLHIRDIRLSGTFSVGVELTADASGSAIYDELADITITGIAANGAAIRLLPAGGKVVNSNRLINIVTGPNTNGAAIGLDDQGSHETVVINGDFSTGDVGTATVGIKLSANTRDFFVMGCSVESNATGVLIAASEERAMIIGCTIDSNTLNVNDLGNRTFWMSNVAGLTPSFGLDTSANLMVTGIGLNGAAAVAAGVNSTNGWTLAAAGTNVAQINTGTFQLLKPLLYPNTTPVANLNTAPITYNHSGTQVVSPHLVIDTCTLGTNCGVTLTGSAVFTNSTSYQCAASDSTANNAVGVTYTSGSAITFTGTGVDVIHYICAGS